MSQTVLLCPGQGAQAVGMGTAWAAASSAARTIIETADRTVSLPIGMTLSAICANGPLEQLSRTDISQPALYTVGVACAAAMRERAPLSLATAAGLSLGEYTALHLAGSFSFEDGTPTGCAARPLHAGCRRGQPGRHGRPDRSRRGESP